MSDPDALTLSSGLAALGTCESEHASASGANSRQADGALARPSDARTMARSDPSTLRDGETLPGFGHLAFAAACIDASRGPASLGAGEIAHAPDGNGRARSPKDAAGRNPSLQSTLMVTRERLSVAVDSARIGLWEIDLCTGAWRFSRTAAEIMGHPLDQPIDETQSLAAIHPDDRQRVRGIVEAMIRGDEGVGGEIEYRLRRCDADGPFWAVTTGKVMRDRRGVPLRMIGSVRDVTSSRRQRDELARMAFEDDGTGLPNRRALMRWLAKAAETDAAVSVLVLDIDDFKRTVDIIGSSATDCLVHAFAARLRKAIPAASYLARLGGDEFAVAIPNGATGGQWSRQSKAIHASLRRPFVTVDGRAVFVEVSIGAASIDPATRSIEDLLARASLSLREAKAIAKGSTRQFTPAMQSERVKVHTVVKELPRAVSNKEFAVHYQPQVRLADRSLSGAEALLRWRHPKRGLLSPFAFIDELARSRWASPVGTHVLETACADAAVLIKQRGPVMVGVNLFASQFRGHRLDQVVKRAMARHGLPAGCLEIEITENIILADDQDILRSLKKLRDIGCGIAFDDYGTGYASLSMLKRYPITRLKIDCSFVSNICESPADRAIVEAVLGLGRTFGLDVIAEGIETEAQHALLVESGCLYGQGYLYGKPMPFQELIGADDGPPASPDRQTPGDTEGKPANRSGTGH